MKRLIYVLFPVLLGCGNSSKENSQYDKVMIFSSDTSYVNDISWQMDDLLSGFYQDSSNFFNWSCKNNESEPGSGYSSRSRPSKNNVLCQEKILI
ncbi:Uncharacterised protein [Sphingobacterium multivorum]|uniref:Uncharacterized protein n=1 Tax=Sphingobacterium multivorum TaxID=28454 RepID=A0A2X2IN34_SPHMU|nr:hypothetical protein [Sphingobacterium multivorum]SPZ83657.1 Uncharacterised protein [Sphingobacterium multivorum]